MNTIVIINNVAYYATKRRIKGTTDRFDAVFRPVGSKVGVIVLHDAIRKKIGMTGGNGLGPFGSPATFGIVYNVRQWGDTSYIDQRAWQCLADQTIE